MYGARKNQMSGTSRRRTKVGHTTRGNEHQMSIYPAPLRKNRAVTPNRIQTIWDTLLLWSHQTQNAFSSVRICRNFCNNRQCRMRLLHSLFTCVFLSSFIGTCLISVYTCFNNKEKVIKKIKKTYTSLQTEPRFLGHPTQRPICRLTYLDVTAVAAPPPPPPPPQVFY
jgi:hypothetical protein